MHFLHTDPEKAAAAICEQDVLPYLIKSIEGLGLCFHSITGGTILSKWLEEDALNYHWLGYFCERLQYRLPGSEYYSEIQSLRRSIPVRLRIGQLTPFPKLSNDLINFSYLTGLSDCERRIASHRADYVLTRHSYAVWSTSEVPAWFFRLANTILPERDKQNFLLRVEPAGPYCPDDKGSTQPKREDVRDGPVGEGTGADGGSFCIW